MTTEKAKEVKSVQVTIDQDLSTATINGTKVAEISPEGNVVVFTNEGVQTKPAISATADAATEDKQVSVGKDFNTVAMYGAKVELAIDGSLIVYTNGTVKVKPAPANDTAIAKVKPALEIGAKMADGTIFAGISPDTNQPMYAAPADAPLCLTFKKAAEYAKNFEVGGKKDFRVPSKAELKVLFDNREKGALKGAFNLTGSDTAGWYWSSTPGINNYAWQQRFSDGTQSNNCRYGVASVRCVR